MSFFGNVIHTVSSWGKTAVHATTSFGETVEHGLEDAGTAVGQVVVQGADAVSSGVTTAANTIASGGSQAFDSAVHAGEQGFDDVKSSLDQALQAGEASILSASAKARIQELQPTISQLVNIWPEVRSAMSPELAILRDAAQNKSVTSDAENALRNLAKNSELAAVLGQFHSKSFVSFGFEFGASAAAGVGINAAVGVIAGLPNVTDIRGYGAVGGSVGVAVGGEVDESLVVNYSSPENSGGPFVNVIFSVEAEVGGTIIVSFNLPDFSFGGLSIGLGEGAEASVSVGGGYSWVF